MRVLAIDTALEACSAAVLDTESLTLSVGLDLDDASRAALLDLATEQAGQPGGGQLSPAAAERLLDARIVTVMATTDGSDLSEVDGTAVADDAAAGERDGNRFGRRVARVISDPGDRPPGRRHASHVVHPLLLRSWRDQRQARPLVCR